MADLKTTEETAADPLDGTEDFRIVQGAVNRRVKVSGVFAYILTVDGSLSGLDADLLDGQHGAFYRDAANLNAGILPAARFDNVAHGTRAGGTLHATVTTTVDGFMAAADKTKLDGIESGATADQTATEIVALVDGENVNWTGLHDFTTGPTVGGTDAVMHKGRGLSNQEIMLADDTATTVTLPANCGSQFILAISSSSGFARAALVWGTPSGNVNTIMAQALTQYETLDGVVLTGTSGTDGKTTLGINAGTLYLENRSGNTTVYSLSFLSNR